MYRKVILLCALVGLLSGCEMLVANAAMDFNISLEPAEVTIAQGESEQITVKVSRILPVDVTPFPLTVTLYSPPEGVTLKEGQVEIPSGIKERQLTIEVAKSAERGDFDVVVEVSSGFKTKQAKLKLTVSAP